MMTEEAFMGAHDVKAGNDGGETFGPDDILGKKKPSKKKENANERH